MARCRHVSFVVKKCCNASCQHVLTTTEIGSVRNNHIQASKPHTNAWCSDCRSECDICKRVVPKNGLESCDSTSGSLQVCASCRRGRCSNVMCGRVSTEAERGTVRKDNLGNSEKPANTNVRCNECKETGVAKKKKATIAHVHMACGACNKQFHIEEAGCGSIYNLQRRAAWICDACVLEGYSSKDTVTYSCEKQGCSTKGGHKLFASQDIRNKRRGLLKHLSCNTCKSAKRQRQK